MRRLAAALALVIFAAGELGAQTTPSRTFRFRDADASHHVDVQAPATVGTNRLCELEDDATPFDPCVTASGGGTSDGGAGVLQGSDGSGGFAAFGGSSCPANEFASSISNMGGLVCAEPAGGGGGGALSVATKTGAYTATSSDDVLICDPSGGAFTISLPAASGFTKRLTIRKARVGNFTACTIDPDGAETIHGASTYVLQVPTASITIASTGTEWIVVESAMPEQQIGSASTFTTGSVYWPILGNMDVNGVEGSRVSEMSFAIDPVAMRCDMYGGTPDNGGGTEGYTITRRAGSAATSWSCAIMDAVSSCSDFTGSAITTTWGHAWESVSTGSPQTNRRATCSLWFWRR